VSSVFAPAAIAMADLSSIFSYDPRRPSSVAREELFHATVSFLFVSLAVPIILYVVLKLAWWLVKRCEHRRDITEIHLSTADPERGEGGDQAQAESRMPPPYDGDEAQSESSLPPPYDHAFGDEEPPTTYAGAIRVQFYRASMEETTRRLS